MDSLHLSNLMRPIAGSDVFRFLSIEIYEIKRADRLKQPNFLRPMLG